MSKKRKKSNRAQIISAGAGNSGLLPNEKDAKRIDPTSRRLLLLSVILIVLAQVLEYTVQAIPHAVGNGLAILGVIALGGFFISYARHSKG